MLRYNTVNKASLAASISNLGTDLTNVNTSVNNVNAAAGNLTSGVSSSIIKSTSGIVYNPSLLNKNNPSMFMDKGISSFQNGSTNHQMLNNPSNSGC